MAKNTGAKTINEFSTNLFNAHGIGYPERNEGVLIVLAIKEKAMRIELGLGYGTAENCPLNNTIGDIIDSHFTPYFNAGNSSKGIVDGTRAVIAAVNKFWQDKDLELK